MENYFSSQRHNIFRNVAVRTDNPVHPCLQRSLLPDRDRYALLAGRHLVPPVHSPCNSPKVLALTHRASLHCGRRF